MKHFNSEIRPLFPFTMNNESGKSIMLYRFRDMRGNHGYYQCDIAELYQMLNNQTFFDNLVWLDIEFEVFDHDDNTFKYRHWRFAESASGWHYWLDQDNHKWHKQD